LVEYSLSDGGLITLLRSKKLRIIAFIYRRTFDEKVNSQRGNSPRTKVKVCKVCTFLRHYYFWYARGRLQSSHPLKKALQLIVCYLVFAVDVKLNILPKLSCLFVFKIFKVAELIVCFIWISLLINLSISSISAWVTQSTV